MTSSPSIGISEAESVPKSRCADEDISMSVSLITGGFTLADKLQRRSYYESSVHVMPVSRNWVPWLAKEKSLKRAITTLSLLAWNLPAGFHQDDRVQYSITYRI